MKRLSQKIDLQAEENPAKNNLVDHIGAEELDLGDDIETYAPKFGENMGYPDTDLDDDDDEITEYKYNSSKKMTKEKRKEMEAEQKRDQQIPLNLNDNPEIEAKENPKETKSKKQPDETEAAEAENLEMSEKEASKMLRKLNKKADENIKVIELNTDMSLTSKCDDSKTKRSSVKTTNMVKGKKSRKKDLDPELKNCVFPFKTMQGQGKGKKKKPVMNMGCVSDGAGAMCATERNEDCTVKKFGYCKD